MKKRIQYIHFVGIGGTGMCGIAEVLHNQGYCVSGSDMAQSTVTEHLQSIGVRVCFGHRAEHIANAQVLVTSTAVTEDNPEVQAARQNGVPVIPRAMMLAELMRFGNGIAIGGTHGKTTTTSLTASILGAAGLDPTFVIGGRLTAAGVNAKLGRGEYIVAEADESDASFLYLTPLFCVVTNIDEDHMETYDHSIDKLHQAFIEFIHRMPFYGKAFLCRDNEHIQAILPEIKKPFATYGLTDEADIYATNIHAVGAKMRFDVHIKHNGQSFPVELNFPGLHSVQNALGAICVALECGVNIRAIRQGLAEFAGVGRRFQSHGEIRLPENRGHALLIDDYGHHPVEMRVTLNATRAAYPDRRLVLVFQPHRYSRTRDLFEEFVDVLATVDVLVLTEVYPAGEAPIVAADSKALARAIRVLGKVEPIYEADIQELPNTVHTFLQNGDVVLTMGAGSINKVPDTLVKLAKEV